MRQEIRIGIESCFRWGNSPDNCYGVPALMEQKGYWDEIDWNDDDDAQMLAELMVRSMRCVEEPTIEFVEYVLSKGFDINTRLPDKGCLLLHGVDSWLELPMLQKLIQLGADPYAETSQGDNALLIAAGKKYDETDRDGNLTGYAQVPVYLAQQLDLSRLDKPDRFGITPLLYAVMHGHARLARTLLDRGCDVNAAGTRPIGGCSYWLDMDGVTPLAMACRCGNVEMARMLLEAGADETLRNAKGQPVSFSLLRYPFGFFRDSQRYNDPIYDQKVEILGLLKELELTDGQGYTLLMRSLCDSPDTFDKASAYSNLPITQALIRRGADVAHTGNDGRQALHLAVTAVGDAEKLLIKAGAPLDVQDREGNTPLLIACLRCSEKKVRYLLKSGADFTLRNNKGESAMDIAAAKGYADALELMMGQ